MRKYHPDRFHDEDKIKRANQKMTEINAAYDQIDDDRRNGVSPNKYRSYSGQSTARRSAQTNVRRERPAQEKRYSHESMDLSRVRELIKAGMLGQADKVLDETPELFRNAEWHYLRGRIRMERGRLNEAYHSILRATQMDPGNMEYETTFRDMNRRLSGYMTKGSPKGGDGGICR